MEKPRIRIDFKKNGKAVVTKSSVVAAVKRLEQSRVVTMQSNSQELINWVMLHLSIKSSICNTGISVDAHLIFSEPLKANIYGVDVPLYKDVAVCWFQSDNEVINTSVNGATGVQLQDAIPILLAELIIRSGMVKVSESDIDKFI